MTICWPLLILMYYKQSSSLVLTLTFKKDNKQQIYIRAYCLGKRKTKKNVFCAAAFIFFKVIHLLEKRLKVWCIYCIDVIVSSHQQCVCALFLKFTVLLCIHTYHYMHLCAMLFSVTAFFILCNLRFIRSSFIGLACLDTCYNGLAFHLFYQNRMSKKTLP